MSRAEDEEEDFFDMLSKGEDPEPRKGSQLVDPMSHVHGLIPTDNSHPLKYATGPIPPSPLGEAATSFAQYLAEFYSKHNFGNLDKVDYLAEKFELRRWELWEQLSIKYKLSPKESRVTWVKFIADRYGPGECARKLFDRSELVTILDDIPSMRKTAWVDMLGLNALDSQRGVYQKYTEEITFPDADSESANVEIMRDVQRTHQELAFFHGADTQAALAQILLTYTRINGIHYVQGMNELLALTFYVMRDESTSFWAFNSIMSQLKDIFTAEADSTQEGIFSRIDILSALLRDYDYKLWKHLTEIQFPLATLAMRWLTTLLAMDLQLPDALRIWDILLQATASHQLLTMSVCLSLSYLLSMSESLLTIADPQDSMELASHFGRGPHFDVDDLIMKSLSVFAFESTLRGRYPASSDEPLLDALVDVVGIAGNRVKNILSSEDVRKGRDLIVQKVSTARESVAGWIDRFVPFSSNITLGGSAFDAQAHESKREAGNIMASAQWKSTE